MNYIYEYLLIIAANVNPYVLFNIATYTRCNFENGLCGWTQLTSDDFNWSREQGESTSSGTGPSADHTSGTPTG